MRAIFDQTIEHIKRDLQAGEDFLCYFSAEATDFCRLNKSVVRQAGHVNQCELSLRLIKGKRHASFDLTLSGTMSDDKEVLKTALTKLRSVIDQVDEDPFLLYATEARDSESVVENKLPASQDIIARVIDASRSLDLVGIYCSGAIYRGFANSFGQRNWYESYSFNFDWSLYLKADKASKHAYAGFEWDEGTFQRILQQGQENLKILAKPAKTIDPGRYRVYLSPSAMGEIFALLSWDSFGLKAQKSKRSALMGMVDAGRKLHTSIELQENIAGGVSPNFDTMGFLRPEQVPLVSQGALAGCLVSARSAKEYDCSPNGANGGEAPESLELAGGRLPNEDVLSTLGDGLYINNLWYLNYSDRQAGRLTGMTRFATFWVENGQLVAPLNVMRFDETVYNLLGDQLEGLTQNQELLLSPATYSQRDTESMCLPGAIVDRVSFTL